MVKPEYFKIKLPVSKKYFKTGINKYLKSLIGMDVEIRFSEKRKRKVFKYKITGIDEKNGISIDSEKIQKQFDLKFKKKNH